MNSKIVMVLIAGGQYIIGKDVSDAEDIDDVNVIHQKKNNIELDDARIFDIQMTPRGVAISFMPIFLFNKNQSKELSHLSLDRAIVVKYVDEKYIDGEILNGYKSHISGIDLSAANSAKGIIL